MIAVDTSALMAVVLRETEAERCAAALRGGGRLLISAVTLAEALIVASRRNLAEEMSNLLSALGFEIVAATADSAHRAATAYDRWGKGVHPAGLNIVDCFAYQLANDYGCRLLYVGEDFARTDVAAAG